MDHAQRIVQSWAARRIAAPAPPIELRERAWFNPGLRSRDYNVPAVMGNVLMILSLMLTSLAVVRERELGTLEQLMVSPLTPGELIVGKTVPFALLCMADLVLITVVALLWFRVPFEGSFALLALAGALYLVSTLGLGLLISTFSATQQEAVLTSFLFIMPLMLLSGFMFPVTSMPLGFQWLTLANPVRHFLEIVRAVFLKGAGLAALWPQFLALALIGAAVLALAARRFHKTAA
jgi:ABC-2 type transport system permease protein